jgi:hypothetical protein
MKHAKLFSILVFTAAALYGAIGFYCLPLAGFEGDLTRMYKLPETLFGWTKPRPAVDPGLIRQAAWQDADVLVVGDSFSASWIWQTALTREGLRVRTEHWGSIRAICEDFAQSIRDRGFRGKYVILQIIERNVEEGLATSAACKKMEYHSSADTDNPRGSPATSVDRGIKDYSGRLSVGIQVWLNVLEYDLRGNGPAGAKMERLPDGCSLFSHARCNDVLFLGNDRVQDLGEDSLANMETINARFDGLVPIWVIVPDKSTAYLHPDKHFWDKAERSFHAPNLLETFRQAIRDKIVDLYPANNTHLSTTGYLLMGDAIYRSIPDDEQKLTAAAEAGHPGP